jgi:TRAP-type uncharacterized transport system fused permease subunit
MAFLRNKWSIVALVMFCWALSGSLMAGYYYLQFNELSAKVKRSIILSNFGINYGNGSLIWFNGTKVNAGSTLFDLTELLASVNYNRTQEGVSIDALNGVFNSYPKYWTWWSWSSYGWIFGPIASDRYIVGENETLLWYYQDLSNYPPLPPP